jgi:ABC-type glycerol-3-phosphate transport system permease component
MKFLKKHFGSLLLILILVAFFVICIYPLIWMFAGSLKDSNEFYTNIWGFASKPNFNNYITAWQQGKLGEKFLNSVIVTAGSILLMIPINSFAAYAIGRLRFKGRMLIYSFLLLGIMIPGGVLGIPTFQVALALHLNNSHLGLILIYVSGSIAMGVFIMRAFFISLPKGLEEAAMLDGCNRFQCFTKIILPLAKPGIVTQIIFSGLGFWNEYFFANMMLTSEDLRTLPVALANFSGRHGVDFPVLFAALSIITIPVIIIYIIAQRGFVEGLTAGAMKG